MPIAANLGLTPISAPLVAPFALGLGGNAVTVSTAIWDKMKATGAPETLSAAPVGQALAAVVVASPEKLRFGVVHQHSSHNYELRYWLAASGIDPDHAVEIVVLPPPLMADALAAGKLDGYCVGEPWNSVAVASGAGRIVTVKAAIWPRSPEKVLGVTETWAASNPEPLEALLRALYRAAQWCGDPANHVEAARLLAQPTYLGVAAESVESALTGHLQVGNAEWTDVADFFVPFQGGATVPHPTHALWFYSQMVRWGDVLHTAENARHAALSFRPGLYRKALARLVPDLVDDASGSAAANFFDQESFDPTQLDDYIATQRHPA